MGLDTPVFDSEDTDWSEGILDGVEARDPELRSMKRLREDVPSASEVPFESHRHSDSLPETPRMSGIMPSFRRSLSHVEGPSRRSSPEPAQPQGSKTYQRRTPRGKRVVDQILEEREQRERRGKEAGSKTSGSERSRSRRKLIVGSDDETQPPSDDDGAVGVGYGTTTGGGSVALSFSFHIDTQGVSPG